MRWSLFSFVALLVVLIAEVTALPTPQDGSSELSLEHLAVTKPKAPAGKAKSGSAKASNFKKPNKTYRNAALRGKNYMFSVKAGNLVKSKARKTVPKGKYADHIFETQTMGRAARKGGHLSTTLRHAYKAVTDRINDPKDVAFLDSKTNSARGRAHSAVQSAKTPAKDKNVVEYLKKTKVAEKATAADNDEISKADRIQPRSPWKAGKELESVSVPYGLSIL